MVALHSGSAAVTAMLMTSPTPTPIPQPLPSCPSMPSSPPQWYCCGVDISPPLPPGQPVFPTTLSFAPAIAVSFPPSLPRPLPSPPQVPLLDAHMHNSLIRMFATGLVRLRGQQLGPGQKLKLSRLRQVRQLNSPSKQLRHMHRLRLRHKLRLLLKLLLPQLKLLQRRQPPLLKQQQRWARILKACCMTFFTSAVLARSW